MLQRLKRTDQIYRLNRLVNHRYFLEGEWRDQWWAELVPIDGGHVAHWKCCQLEPVPWVSGRVIKT